MKRVERLSEIYTWNSRIKMAQICEEEQNEVCENMEMKKLNKVVFAGAKNAYNR